ncbi:MAG TPA: GTPase Era [Alphaproteobacteria bacterium]
MTRKILSPKPPKTCGFVALLGQSNVGKSTLLNRLVGQKLAIVSPKLHSTRRRLLGIVIHKQAQIIFIDTPGLLTAKSKMEKAMLHSAYESGGEADIMLVMVDAAKPQRARKAIDNITMQPQLKNKKKILLINKIDLVPKANLLELIAELNAAHDFIETLMISATKEDGLDILLDRLGALLPKGAWHYSEEQVTDTPMKVLAAEVTREKLYMHLQQELPYACTVQTEVFDESDPAKWHLQQVIVVEKESQRAIILGHKGQMIKKIGQASRRTLQGMFEVPVDLRLFVKVDPKWQDDKTLY